MIAGLDVATFLTFAVIAFLAVVGVGLAVLDVADDRADERRDRRIRRELERHPFEDLTDETTVRLVQGRRDDDE